MKGKQNPELRLPGYPEEWGWRKLNQISNKVTEKNKNNLYSETLTNSAEFGIVSQRDFFEKDISNEKNINGYYVVQHDDFVYNPRISTYAPVGPIKRNKLGRTGVMSPLYYVFRTKHVDNLYLESYFSSTKWHIYMKLNGDTGARSDRFAIKDSVFGEMPIPFPPIEEQTRIGSFFKQLDETISLHEQELTTLKQTKQGFLQKLFPKEGETVPEIRFPGFSGKWKKHKLSDLTEVFLDGDWIESKDQSNSGIRLIQTGNIGVTKFINKPGNEKWISEETFLKLKCNEVYPGDILISRLPAPAGRACILPSIGTRMITAVDCTIIRVNNRHSAEFLVQFLSTSNYFKKVNSYLGGGTRQRISKSVLADIEVVVPKEYSEQIKIGEFFKQLDETIELHEKELEALKETKKAFLQKMFV